MPLSMYLVWVCSSFFKNDLIYPNRQKDGFFFTEIVLPIVYFVFAMYLLSAYGEGGMVSRYDGFLLNGESGMLMVIKNLFFHPGYVISTLLTAKRLGYLFFNVCSGVLLRLAPTSLVDLFPLDSTDSD